MKFKIGDRVRYVSARHGESSINPLWGGKYGNIAGTVDRHYNRPRSLPYGVLWDNKTHNSYSEEDLVIHQPVFILEI